MKGRAIARPNPILGAHDARDAHRPSMEGRAIARPNQSHTSAEWSALLALQWRAGQLPGQTTAFATGWTFGRPPSMEGRAIARPNLSGRETTVVEAETLQWRAGQLPGQT